MPLTRFGKEGAPCPFCGSNHLRVYVSSQPHVCCMACGVDGPVVRHAANEAGPFIAIDLWNRRVSQAPLVPEGKLAMAVAAMERAFGTGVNEADELLRENSGAKRIYDCAIIALIATSDGDTAPGVRS